MAKKSNKTGGRKAGKIIADDYVDPQTEEEGTHVVGTGLGAAVGGALAGGIAGTMGGGPVGTVVGTVVGGVLGGLAGHEAGEQVDPTHEHAYWQEHYRERPYFNEERADYETYAPAYQYGWESYQRFHSNQTGSTVEYDEVEAQLRDAWEQQANRPKLRWEEANEPIRDAWKRVENEMNRTSGKRKAK